MQHVLKLHKVQIDSQILINQNTPATVLMQFAVLWVHSDSNMHHLQMHLSCLPWFLPHWDLPVSLIWKLSVRPLPKSWKYITFDTCWN